MPLHRRIARVVAEEGFGGLWPHVKRRLTRATKVDDNPKHKTIENYRSSGPEAILYVEDWSPVPQHRFDQAQTQEREYWTGKNRDVLKLQAQYNYCAGFHAWIKHKALLNPFRIDRARPRNFQLSGEDVAGGVILDVGCGPITSTLSLVHCATVHVVDPLVSFYQQIQPFGWEHFASITPTGAEQLPFASGSINFVHCRNVLDHTQNAHRILSEIARVLCPTGQLLLDCDVRGTKGGGAAHPYKWTVDVFEAEVFKRFKPVTEVALLAYDNFDQAELARWVCRLQKHPNE